MLEGREHLPRSVRLRPERNEEGRALSNSRAALHPPGVGSSDQNLLLQGFGELAVTLLQLLAQTLILNSSRFFVLQSSASSLRKSTIECELFHR
jgi:hypothetical protein